MSQLNHKQPEPDTTASSAEQPKAIEELMAEFDKESATRHFRGRPKKIIQALFIGFALYVFWMTLIATPPEQVRRASFIGLLIFLGFLVYPVKKAHIERVNYIPWYDYGFALLGSGAFFYYVINFQTIVAKAINIGPVEIAVGVIGTLMLIELCRRVVGIPILVVALSFVVYAFYKGHSLKRVIHQLFYTTDGIIGTPLGVAATFIVLFIILGSFLEKTGIGNFFIDLANSIAGYASGGPAKVAVISSALEGMYSGSSVANTVGSGSVTIPIMKKTGYKPEFAAAVEAAASTGGQIMPPIMGAAAFLMAELTDTPYSVIAVTAILPALLYFTGIFMMIHFEAKKLGLKGLPKETLPNFWKLLLKKGYLFLPILTLIALMSLGRTPANSAVYAILAAVIVSMFSKETRMSPATFAEALAGGSRNTMGVAVACAIAGIIVGIVTLTGLGQDLLNVLMSVAGTSKFLALFLTMVSCIILGMGVPTTANYVIMATITAPIVMSMGVPMLAAHMFVFYFGIVADITPPVALAAYAGSAIAKSDPFKTGVTATRLAITAFIVPYIFAYSPAMLLIDTTPLAVVRIVITSLVGIFGIAAGMEGWMFTRMAWWERILIIGAGLLSIDPSPITDILGVGLMAAIIFYQFSKSKRTVEAAA
ncbi:TRAP transporter permease [Proteiniclasticum sp. QWL-01]|uniref:TRAP transporter permease n=1 Tax=Proteiniclasticum sp. QWL-01 TaxID=3036945 RepID=UPI0022014EED|nr:TRAP transporter permease [Proteiniclasticum sp. QWL-01]UUM10900.1 TRAP transporter permease [Clostridiaceae bacterium HFYG-1003]WFF72240.1 TRAP transporter permease [Proteiniclasticum sp. QWL-01]